MTPRNRRPPGAETRRPGGLTEGGIVRPLLGLALPFALGSALHLLSTTINRAWVGRVGTEALAALGVASQALMVLIVCAMGMAIGTLAGVARSTGERDPAQAARYFGQGLNVALLTGAVIALSAAFLPAPLMAWMGAPGDVAGPATGYLRIGMIGMLVQAPLFAVTYALQGAGEARASVRISAVAPVANLALDPLFIFGFGWGVPGAAVASVLSSALGLATGLWIISRGRTGLRLERDAFRPRAAILGRIIAVGFPGSLEHVVRTVAGFLLVVLLTGFGPAVLSAYTSANMITMTLIFPGVALGQATAALIGQNLGAGRPDRAWRTAWASAGLYAAFMTALGVLIWWFAGPLVGFFDGNPVVVDEGRRLLQIMVLCFPLLGVALTLSRAFAGAGSTVPAMVVAAIAHLLVQIPLARFLSARFGPPGAYWAMAAAFMLHGVLSGGLFFHRFRRWRAAPAG